jgi:hypothetical protein
LKQTIPFIFITLLFFSALTQTESTEKSFSYEEYYVVLSNYVDEESRVNYKKLKENETELMSFIHALASLEPNVYRGWYREEKIAFWINAYNALTLNAIVMNYPIKSSFFKSLRFPKNSIRQIPGVWNTMTFTVMGEEVTLDFIEHQVLRKEFQEPRIHMALVCAAKGCPPLRMEPYKGEVLSEQLNNQAQRFLSDKRNFFIDKKKGVVYLSSIFKWFGEDFFMHHTKDEKTEGNELEEKAVLNFISRYLSEEDRKYLKEDSLKVKYLNYDWALNEQEENK